MYRKMLVCGVALVGMSLVGWSSTALGPDSSCAADNSWALPRVELMQWGNPRTDRQSCEQECRSRYGIDPYSIEEQYHGGYTRGYQVYANCIAACERQFWNRFDRRMEQLK
jgi:hypothetical protein